MTETKAANTPMNTAYLKLEGEGELLPFNEQYRQAVGARLYIATIAHPDIIAAMSLLYRHVSKPHQRY